jgi:hypothetical protein
MAGAQQVPSQIIAQRDHFCASANIHGEFRLLIYDKIVTPSDDMKYL